MTAFSYQKLDIGVRAVTLFYCSLSITVINIHAVTQGHRDDDTAYILRIVVEVWLFIYLTSKRMTDKR
ncbi:MAG: hypothetical protein L0G25_00805, partial [Psychrobacter sp.]|nr:hypothetical protein [Psychrobacter sp.]